MFILDLGGGRGPERVRGVCRTRSSASNGSRAGAARSTTSRSRWTSLAELEAVKQRLVDAGADIGEIQRLGDEWSLFFRDVDGMELEVLRPGRLSSAGRRPAGRIEEQPEVLPASPRRRHRPRAARGTWHDAGRDLREVPAQAVEVEHRWQHRRARGTRRTTAVTVPSPGSSIQRSRSGGAISVVSQSINRIPVGVTSTFSTWGSPWVRTMRSGWSRASATSCA